MSNSLLQCCHPASISVHYLSACRLIQKWNNHGNRSHTHTQRERETVRRSVVYYGMTVAGINLISQFICSRISLLVKGGGGGGKKSFLKLRQSWVFSFRGHPGRPPPRAKQRRQNVFVEGSRCHGRRCLPADTQTRGCDCRTDRLRVPALDCVFSRLVHKKGRASSAVAKRRSPGATPTHCRYEPACL